jgi:hypothetical protein
MWIGAVCGLLASDHVYSQGNQHNRKKKRTSAVGTRQVLGPVQLFRWFEGKRQKVRDETCRKRKVLSVDEVVPEAAEGRRWACIREADHINPLSYSEVGT